MQTVVTWNLGDNFLDKLSDFLLDNFKTEKFDFSKVACVFGGKRPALFLRRELAQKIKDPFYPPRTFSIDEFIEYIVTKGERGRKIQSLEAAHSIYQIVEKHSKNLLKKRSSFAEFLPWAREINSFIEQLDLEDIPNSQLKAIAKSAEIGYDVPASINSLLGQIVKIRNFYHSSLDENNFYSRGRLYLEASRQIKDRSLDEFEVVIFCNFFYLHRTELSVIKEVKDKGKGICIFGGSSKEWSVLEKNSLELGSPIEPKAEGPRAKETNRPALAFYQGFDLQSQVALIHQAFKKIPDKQNTVIVLPQPQTLIPLLTEISSSLDEYNVSMGYPLARTSLFSMLDALAKVQESKKDSKIYIKDYLSLIRHPLVKNLRLADDPSITRVIVHKLEELLEGRQESSIGGSLFLTLAEIEQESKIYSLAAQTLNSMNIDIKQSQCRRLLAELHRWFFTIWGKADSFLAFADNFQSLLKLLVENSQLEKFPLNLKVIEKLQDLVDEFRGLSFSQQRFPANQIWEIFEQRLKLEKIAFLGSPLKGTQILGLFETRCLSFENVIVADLNEGVLPKLKIHQPLIPREVMLNLGLGRLEKEEEIQRYQFSSLVAAAKSVQLVYEKNQQREKSRFLEEIFWKMEKEKASLGAAVVSGISFSLGSSSRSLEINKTPQTIEHLKQQKYSASRINTYLQCSLKFYYQYVLGLKEQEDLLDELQSSHIGTFIHELLEETFKKFKGSRPLIDKKFKDYFFHKMQNKFSKELTPRMKSDSFLLERIIRNRLERFLDAESERQVKQIICLEEKRQGVLDLGSYSLGFNYTIDRIDELEDKSILIIDYKTGGADFAPKKLKALRAMEMSRESIKENIKSFQLPLYYYFIAQEFPGRELNAELYNLRSLEHRSFIAQEDLFNGDKVLEICLGALSTVFDELFDPAIAFRPEPEERKCSFCPFRGFCI